MNPEVGIAYLSCKIPFHSVNKIVYNIYGQFSYIYTVDSSGDRKILHTKNISKYGYTLYFIMCIILRSIIINTITTTYQRHVLFHFSSQFLRILLLLSSNYWVFFSFSPNLLIFFVYLSFPAKKNLLFFH